MKFIPSFDKGFLPLSVVLKEYKEQVKASEHKELKICVERNKGYNYVYSLDIFSDEKMKEKNYEIAERIIKSILWVIGGYKIFIKGDEYVFERIHADYTPEGKRAFDVDFMQTVYGKTFEVIYAQGDSFPKEHPCEVKIGGHLNGCRIGFDAGGSDRKVSAVIDGKTVYSEEVVWFPKTNSDYHYHYNGIMEAFKTAGSKMPRIDGIGVSSAGVYIDNQVKVSSLFIKVPKEEHKAHVENIYLDVAKELGVPIEVANDGDVTALAGAMELNDNCVLGIAMGTSEAGGYINKSGLLNGWLSELAFVPVDFNKNAMVDEWSGDYGCGVKYFSQDAVIKLAENAGYKFNEKSTLAEKLVEIQKLMEKDDIIAKTVYEDIGKYLGYAIPFYAEFYEIKYLLLLGRVTTGKGGQIIIDFAEKVLKEEFPQYGDVKILMPDESNKRLGQSIVAASLPEIKE